MCSPVAESQVLFSKAMQSGCVPVTITNSLVQGEAGVGKSSTMRILLDQPHTTERTSTNLAESAIPLRVDTFEPSSSVRDVLGTKVQSKARKWSAMSESELENTVVKAIANIKHLEQKSKSNISLDHLLGTLSKAATFGRLLFQRSFNTPLMDTSSSVDPIPSPQDAVAMVYGELANEMEINSNMFLRFDNSTLVADNASLKMLGSDWIYFTDTGGQPHFHNLLPHFVHGSIVILVIRLSEKLDAHPIVEYYEEGQLISEPFLSSLTTEETIKCLVRSMQSHTIDEKKP